MFTHLLAATVSFVSVALITPLFMKIGLKTGLVGVDVHKVDRPVVPKSGGPVLLIGALAGLSAYPLAGEFPTEMLALTCSSVIAWIIGLVEDVRAEINPLAKPVMLVLAAAPIIVLSAYSPRLELPFVGSTRLTILYPLLVLASFPIVCNAVNSIDVLNGSLSFTSMAFFSAILAVSVLHQLEFPAAVSSVMLATLAAFTFYNKYPSKIFAGNSGSLFIGAVMTSTAIIGRVEVVAVIALLPQIMNEMYVIFSMRGIRSAKQYNSRPVNIDGGLITANLDRGAPITLVRMLSAGVKVREDSMVKSLAALSFYSAFLAVLTSLLFMR